MSPNNNDPNISNISRIFFDEQADRYSDFYDPQTRSGAAVLFRMRAGIASEMMSGEDATPMLDLATGTGEITLQIAKAAHVATMLLNDFSRPMLTRCEKVFRSHFCADELTWSNRDVFELLPEIQADRFGAILCLGLIAHTGRLQELLHQCHRVLRPGGVVLLQSSLAEHAGARITSLYAESWVRRTRHLHHRFRLADIRNAAANAGFLIVDSRRFGVCLPFGDKLLGRVNFHIEHKYAANMKKLGGEIIIKLRKK